MYKLQFPRRGFIRSVGLICLSATKNTYAGDLSVINIVPIIKLTIASRVSEKMIFATVTFEADGLKKLPQGGWVSLNGVALQAAPLKKQGFWYRADVPKSSTYKLEYLLSSGNTVVQNILSDRPFFPVLPRVVSRSKGLVISFRGAALMSGENISVDIGDPSEGSGRWSEELETTTEGNKLFVPSAEFAKVRLGPAILSVSIFVRGSRPTNRLTYLQGNTDVATVNVID